MDTPRPGPVGPPDRLPDVATTRARECLQERGLGALSDEELVAAVADSSRDALRELYERNEPWLRLRLARRCPDRLLVEEALQDTFLTVWRIAERYRGDGPAAAWIWGIAIRTLLSHMRPRRSLMERLALRRPEITESAESQVLDGIAHGALATALGGLTPELRAVVQATVLDGLTTREAAELLGIPSGTVKTRMQRAKRDLRAALAAASEGSTPQTDPTIPITWIAGT